jgi:hypothetical protein
MPLDLDPAARRMATAPAAGAMSHPHRERRTQMRMGSAS